MTNAGSPAQGTAHGGGFRSAGGARRVPLRHPWWWAGGAVLVLLIALFARLLVTNENMRWSVVLEYLFDREILGGLVTTLELTVLAMVLGLALGVVLAVMRLSANPLFRSVSWLWLWFFRGVPPLVQMVFWFNLATLIPVIELGVPFGPTLASWDTNTVVSSFSAAILGLALTESAYAAEMIRAGIQAVPKGQTEAALVVGMSRFQVLRRVVLPQALRIVVPPIGNDLISMLKFTSLVSVLATPDLLYSAQMIYSRNYRTIPLLLVATIWYLVLTTLLTVAQQQVERRMKLTRAAAGAAGDGRRLRFLPSFGKA
ncbi:amino acid ABC transporter permease [Nonomuraea roseoviolacea subsp. roseoviolacea]|uniref:Polar amino acid transport system permease protein n=1 Tax=Nonomuraea roseoviolacea subsp. carminata TaxID=160689 RepID=A0ABT1JSK1_9ACTN|nr:amino acid ABC transporter permease [Nonomuraea roseoviolacea]MCP2344705.1 polar amino acid transport system permease protein [Nonomuraea roseoviolacea subsp. carminata]